MILKRKCLDLPSNNTVFDKKGIIKFETIISYSQRTNKQRFITK